MIELFDFSENWFLDCKKIEKVVRFISIVKEVPEERVFDMTIAKVEKILDEITTDKITIKDAYLFALSLRPKKKKSLFRRLRKIFRR